MTYRRISLGRSFAIISLATTVFCFYPRSIAAQNLQAKPTSTDRSDAAPSSALDEEPQPTGQDVTGGSLPDAPLPAAQAQGQAQGSPTPSVQTAVQQTNQLPVLPPTLTRTPLTGQDKFLLYVHKSFGPTCRDFASIRGGLPNA
jgi:hypothetical protein